MPFVDAVQCADWRQVGATKPDCHVYHGGAADRVGFGDEGSSVLLEHAD